MHFHNSNNSIPEIHPAADELAMGICLYQQQKANKFHLESEQITYTASTSTSTRQRAGPILGAGCWIPWCGHREPWRQGLSRHRNTSSSSSTPSRKKSVEHTHTHTHHTSVISTGCQDSDQEPGSSTQDIAFIASVCCCWCWQVTAHLWVNIRPVKKP